MPFAIKTVDAFGRPYSKSQILKAVGSGWWPLVLELIQDLSKMGWDGQITQIKEKFGGLRFYVGDGTKSIHSRIYEAEDLSFSLCELCGRKGTMRSDGWMVTLCRPCNKQRQRTHKTMRWYQDQYDKLKEEFDAYKEASATSH